MADRGIAEISSNEETVDSIEDQEILEETTQHRQAQISTPLSQISLQRVRPFSQPLPICTNLRQTALRASSCEYLLEQHLDIRQGHPLTTLAKSVPTSVAIVTSNDMMTPKMTIKPVTTLKDTASYMMTSEPGQLSVSVEELREPLQIPLQLQHQATPNRVHCETSTTTSSENVTISYGSRSVSSSPAKSKDSAMNKRVILRPAKFIPPPPPPRRLLLTQTDLKTTALTSTYVKTVCILFLIYYILVILFFK